MSTTTVKRDLLSSHSTIATFSGLEAGREPMLRIFPPQPAKEWATFDIVEYNSFQKLGEYGDDPQEKFAFVSSEQSVAVQEALASISKGAQVRLAWRHEYLTKLSRGEDGETFESQYPERTVTLLEPV